MMTWRVKHSCATTLFLTLALTASAAPVGATAAVTIRVPLDQPTIQAAIAAASDGDRVLVAPGIYRENVTFLGKAITVAASDGPASTVIDGGMNGPTVSFVSNEPRSAVLRGFTIVRGTESSSSTDGGGIQIANASPTVEHNVVE